MGIPADQAEAWLAGVQAQEGDDEDLVRILPINVWPVRVFCCSQWSVEAGASQMVYTGITSAEIIAACDLLDVPKAERPHVLFGVRTMVACTIDDMNRSRD